MLISKQLEKTYQMLLMFVLNSEHTLLPAERSPTVEARPEPRLLCSRGEV